MEVGGCRLVVVVIIVLVSLSLAIQIRLVGLSYLGLVNGEVTYGGQGPPTDQQQQQHQQQQVTTVSSRNVSPRDMIGTWVGDTWIPPSPWKLFSANELREVYSRHRILWIGDSTARRTSMTLFSILNGTTNHAPTALLNRDIDINKHELTENCTRWSNQTESLQDNTTVYLYSNLNVCRPLPQGGDVTLFPATCLQHVRSILTQEIASGGIVIPEFDLVIVSLGIWHQLSKDCPLEGNETLLSLVQDIVQLMEEVLILQPQLTFVWRTCGFSGRKITNRQIHVRNMNKAIMNVVDNVTLSRADKIDHRITYVNWGAAVEPRSHGSQRIQGDIPAHYGLEPRLVLIQMIANQLQMIKTKDTLVS